MSEQVRLKDGSVEHAAAVNTILINLELLAEIDARALMDAMLKARNPNHPIIAESVVSVLARLGIVRDGHMHDTVRKVLLNAVTEDGGTLAVGNPLAENQGGLN